VSTPTLREIATAGNAGMQLCWSLRSRVWTWNHMTQSGSIILICCIAACAIGCAQPMNPSFPATITQSRCVLHDMEAHPQPLPRPLVIIGGFLDPGLSPAWVGAQFRAISTKQDKIATVSILGRLSFWGYRQEILNSVDRVAPADKNGVRPEVDVIGFSLGGLAARYAAIPENDGRAPLRIARLFTISTPHRGAQLAEAVPVLLNVQGELRYHSARLLEIDNSARNYPIYPYARLGDMIVGVQNTSPPNEAVWWVYTPWFNLAHEGAPTDPRIMADIALRIYDRAPLSTLPRSPLPK
jgi:pimeloyl-ACP methyl ester carboxylesterase